jgi:hypothetical protein
MTSTNVSSPSSNLTLAILSESEVLLWDLHPNREENNVRVFNPYPDDDGVPISCLAWNHNQMVIATSSGIPTDEFEHDNIALLSVQTGQQLDSFQHDGRNQKQQHRHVAGAAANTINFGGKSRYLCIGDENGAICLWDLKKKTRVRQYFHTTNDPSPSLQVSLDPTDTYVMSLSSSAMYVYSLRDGLFMGTLKMPDDTTNGNDYSLFTKYSISTLEPSKCAIGTNDGSIYMYDITNHSQSSPLFELPQRHSGAVTGLAFSAINSNLIISCAQDGIVLAHNISEGTSYEVCALDDSNIIQSMSLHNNGVTCAVGCESGDIYICDIRNSTKDVGISKTMLASYQINGPVHSLHFAPPSRVKTQRLATKNNPNDTVVNTNSTNNTNNTNIVKIQNTVELPMDATPAKFKSDSSNNDDDRNETITTQQQISSVSSPSSAAPKLYTGSPSRFAKIAANSRLASMNSKSPAVKPASKSISNTLTGGSKYQRSTVVVNKTKETTPLSPPTKRRPLDANKYDTVRPQQQENVQQTLSTNNDKEGIREVVREEVEHLQDEMEEQLRNLHIDMINQFHLQSQEIDTALSKHFTTIERLELENQRLREENERLRQDRG